MSPQQPLHVLVTIDTESYTNGHPDQHIWGRTREHGEHGIRRIMDILEAHGARGTFYVNVYEAERHGEAALAEVVRALHGRGHDVELHSHPRDRYGIDKLTRAGVEKQKEVLLWGKQFIERHTGTPVIAHRAGAFAANLDTLEALRQIGVPVDASHSSITPESHLGRQMGMRNSPYVHNDVLELPVTYYTQGRLGRFQSHRLLDIEASGLREMKHVIRQARAAGESTVNVLMHSFTFLRGDKPDLALERRLERLLAWIERQDGIQASTTRQFHAAWQVQPRHGETGAEFQASTGWLLTYLRCVEQIGRSWKNALVALLPFALLALAGLALAQSLATATPPAPPQDITMTKAP